MATTGAQAVAQFLQGEGVEHELVAPPILPVARSCAAR
jgi:hypothetical protein